MSDLLHTALDYAARGWPVFPLHGIVRGRCTCGRKECSSPGRHPLVRRGLHEATTEARVIKEWWSRWRCANIGVATGEGSGIVVIDIDLGRRTNTALGSPGEGNRQAGALDDVWGSLDALIHKLPNTLTALTGGGGLHLLLVRPGDRPLHNHTSRLPGISKRLPGIDLRADGGYIVAPPSMHASRDRYPACSRPSGGVPWYRWRTWSEPGVTLGGGLSLLFVGARCGGANPRFG